MKENLKGRIVQAKVNLLQAQSNLSALLSICTHEYEETKTGSARCKICGEHGGWWCPSSPTHQCEYAPDDMCQDDCIHCHQPDERK